MVGESILRYYFKFTLNHIDALSFIDDFEFSEDWPFIQYIYVNNIITMGYANKFPQIVGKPSNLCIFHKYNVYRIDTNTFTGNVICSGDECVPIPGWDMLSIERIPYTVVYRFDFDFHVMMTLLSMIDDVDILEDNQISLTQSIIMYHKTKIQVMHGILSYSGVDSVTTFRVFYKYIEKRYQEEHEDIEILFKNMPLSNSSNTHPAIDYDVWYRGARENQREWPLISRYCINDRSIEFPKQSGVWYTPTDDKHYVGLSKRHDDGIHRYIPTIYKTDHRKRVSYLSDYINNESKYKPFSLSLVVKNTIKEHGHLYTKYYDQTHEKCIIIGCCGEIISMDQNAEYIMYMGKIVGKLYIKIPYIHLDVQLLDKYFNRSKIHVNGVWKDCDGIRINNVITLPWYYKQIVHDYHKLGRLDNGPYMDLMHIGIVDINGTDRITFPIPDNLYISRSLETHRLITFKFKYYVYEHRKIVVNVV